MVHGYGWSMFIVGVAISFCFMMFPAAVKVGRSPERWSEGIGQNR